MVTSFVLMRQRGEREALTTDHHFDLPAQRREVRLAELGHALTEKFAQDFRACVVAGFADFRLRIDLQKPARHRAPFDLQLVQRVAEQRAARGADLPGTERGAATPREVIARDPFAA